MPALPARVVRACWNAGTLLGPGWERYSRMCGRFAMSGWVEGGRTGPGCQTRCGLQGSGGVPRVCGLWCSTDLYLWCVVPLCLRRRFCSVESPACHTPAWTHRRLARRAPPRPAPPHMRLRKDYADIYALQAFKLHSSREDRGVERRAASRRHAARVPQHRATIPL